MNSKNANKGKNLEKLVEFANGQYLLNGRALISKVPNNWTVLRKFNAFTKKSDIVSAFPSKTIIDFIGILATGRGIAFDTKECASKTSFPLSNIEPHQQQFLQQFSEMKGIAFYLIYFKAHDRAFILFQKDLENFTKVNSRKSIPFHYFEQYTKEIKTGSVFLDYLVFLEE